MRLGRQRPNASTDPVVVGLGRILFWLGLVALVLLGGLVVALFL